MFSNSWDSILLIEYIDIHVLINHGFVERLIEIESVFSADQCMANVVDTDKENGKDEVKEENVEKDKDKEEVKEENVDKDKDKKGSKGRECRKDKEEVKEENVEKDKDKDVDKEDEDEDEKEASDSDKTD